MGICTSCDAVQSAATAKVILQDGRLQEYSYPIKACHVLQQDPHSFLCNSDDMEFDDVVTAVDPDEELQPGHIYFALPLRLLKCPIQPRDMAALAVKASAAFIKNGKCRCQRNQVLADAPGEMEMDMTPAPRKVAAGERRKGGQGRRRKAFTANLGAIAE